MSARVAEVLLAFLRLGCTSFGGPVAHLGYFRAEFVARRKWLDDDAYGDLVALAQFLPGPASSQVGIGLGLLRAGPPGALAAWLGFTLPSAAVMIAAAYGLSALSIGSAGWVHGLQLAAVAVVAQAVWGMWPRLCPDRARAALALGGALAVLAWQTPAAQLAVLAAAGLIGWRFLPRGAAAASTHEAFRLPAAVSWGATALFFVLLAALPLAARAGSSLALFDAFYRAGSLVFGGGHVVLPLLRAEAVPRWIGDDAFLAGYGIAQAVPGPLFSFAAYLGGAASAGPGGWAGGLLALGAIFLPAFLLVFAALPHWSALRGLAPMRAALDGVNAAVVGILLAALYDPVFLTSVRGPADFGLALAAFGLLALGRVAPLWAVLVCALGGAALG
jgi:chromate transporter